MRGVETPGMMTPGDRCEWAGPELERQNLTGKAKMVTKRTQLPETTKITSIMSFFVYYLVCLLEKSLRPLDKFNGTPK